LKSFKAGGPLYLEKNSDRMRVIGRIRNEKNDEKDLGKKAENGPKKIEANLKKRHGKNNT
jgi:hypothetical protein